MQTVTIEELQADFYKLLEEVESGKSIMVRSNHGNIIMLPYLENANTNSNLEVFCDHDDGC